MIDQGSVPSLMGSTVRDETGDKIGKVGQVYLDDTTGQPEWVTVRTGLFGTRESFVPLAAARVEGDELVVDVSKDRVKDAPQIDEDGHLSEQQEAELYSYYGVSPGAFGRDTGPTDGYPADGGYAAGTSGTDAGRVRRHLRHAGRRAGPALPAPAPDPAPTAGSDVTPEAAYAPGTSYAGAAAAATRGTPDAAAGQADPAVVETVDSDSPALGGPGDAGADPGSATTDGADATSQPDDAVAAGEEEAPRTESSRARLRRYAAPDGDRRPALSRRRGGRLSPGGLPHSSSSTVASSCSTPSWWSSTAWISRRSTSGPACPDADARTTKSASRSSLKNWPFRRASTTPSV